MNIVPAILPHSFEELTEKLSRIDGLSRDVQIDICDGKFGREVTWIPDGTETLPQGFVYEFDLMVADCQSVVQAALALGAKRIVIHADSMSEEQMQECAQMVVAQGASVGVAVSNDQTIDEHVAMLRAARNVDSQAYAQVMGIRSIGEQGQVFDEETPGRIVALKQQLGDVLVQVDGAMNPINAPRVLEAGAETLVVGSYIFGDNDPGTALATMNNLA